MKTSSIIALAISSLLVACSGNLHQNSSNTETPSATDNGAKSLAKGQINDPVINSIINTNKWFHINESDEWMVARMEGDILEFSYCTIAYLAGMDTYRYLGQNKFVPVELNHLDEYDPDDAIPFAFESINGVDYLDNQFCSKDISFTQRYFGYYKGNNKSYFVDYSNKKSEGFGSDTYEADIFVYEPDTDSPMGDDYMKGFNFGDCIFFPTTGELKDRDYKVVDKLVRVYPDGNERYPFTATELVSCGSFTKDELKIMRNEIFARHGFIFKTDAMKKHFESQSWYKPTKENVDNLLSNIEQRNVKTISEYEKINK